jgi:hypothetical protein
MGDYRHGHHKGSVASFHLSRFRVWSLTVTSGAMRGSETMAVSFKGAHFPQDIILMGVRWYVAHIPSDLVVRPWAFTIVLRFQRVTPIVSHQLTRPGNFRLFGVRQQYRDTCKNRS